MYASPVYLLTYSEWQKHERCKDRPYAVERGKSNIAKQLQTRCETAGRVAYPIYVETDSLDPADGKSVSLETAGRWLSEFITSVLDVDVESCSFYHSAGVRSMPTFRRSRWRTSLSC